MRFFVPAGLLLLLFLVINEPARAQSDSLQPRLWVFKFSPQHLLVHGYLLEAERRFGATGKHSFTFSPRYFNGNTNTIDKFAGRKQGDLPTKVVGKGFEATHRIYKPHLTQPGKLQYFSYGFNYHQYKIDYAVQGWGEVTGPDGVTTIRYKWHPRQTEVSRLGVVAMFGAQNPVFTKRLLADLYGGIGYRFGQQHDAGNERFQANMLDFASTGFYLSAGLKLGYSF